jgi:predicted transposase/invertase (TIGR01784 family)
VKTDTLFYRLFQERPTLVFELAALPVPGNVAYSLRAEEIKETAFRLDGVLLPPAGRTDLPVVFLEVQFQPDDAFYARWFAEIFLYLYRQGITTEWRAVAIFPRQSVDTAASVPYDLLLQGPWVRRVYLLEDLPDFDHATLGVRLVHLIVASPPQASVQARRLVKEFPEEHAWLLEWIETILVYKFPELTRQEIQMILELTDSELKKSRFYQEVFAEGREEGREEGRQEGRRKGTCAVVLRQLRRRLGSLSPALEQQVLALSLAQLEDLAEALLDFSGTPDLTQWLEKQARGSR